MKAMTTPEIVLAIALAALKLTTIWVIVRGTVEMWRIYFNK